MAISKELWLKDYKGVSRNFGSYAEHCFETGMLSLLLADGSIRPYQYVFSADMMRKHDDSFMK